MIRTFLNKILNKDKYEVQSIYLFTNGKALVFDYKGDQVSKLQGMALESNGTEKIMKYANHNTRVYKNLDYHKYFSNNCVRNAHWVLNSQHDRQHCSSKSSH